MLITKLVLFFSNPTHKNLVSYLTIQFFQTSHPIFKTSAKNLAAKTRTVILSMGQKCANVSPTFKGNQTSNAQLNVKPIPIVLKRCHVLSTDSAAVHASTRRMGAELMPSAKLRTTDPSVTVRRSGWATKRFSVSILSKVNIITDFPCTQCFVSCE